jgi:ATP-dependent 26S proteasome regulatory subunit
VAQQQQENIEKVHTNNWRKLGEMYVPTGDVVKHIPAGVYTSMLPYGVGPCLVPQKPVKDVHRSMPSGVTNRIIEGVETWLKLREKYTTLGILYKRGVLVHGEPGTGKTVTCYQIADACVQKHDAVVFSGQDMHARFTLMKLLRKQYPTRLFVNIMEDLEVLRYATSDDTLLSVLDGADQVDGVIHLATTNYLSKLPPRYMSRPSRFDEVHEVGKPSADARREYLKSFGELSDEMLETLTTVSDGFTLAFLKELFISVAVMRRGVDETVQNLKVMIEKGKKQATDQDFKNKASKLMQAMENAVYEVEESVDEA